MFEFTFKSPLILEESFKDYVMVEATLLTEGRSTHGFLYTVPDADFNLVAESAVDKNVYFGVDVFGQHKAPSANKGEVWLQSHNDSVSGDNVEPVGKIVKSWFDRLARRVKAKIKIWDTSLMSKIRKGFKISIRGLFDKFKDVFHNGQLSRKVFGLRIKDVQIVPPEKGVGVKGAKVEKILEETMDFGFDSDFDLVTNVVLQLVANGEIY